MAEGSREDKESWQNFLRYLKDRGLHGVKLVVSDKSPGLVEVLGDFFPRRNGSGAWSTGIAMRSRSVRSAKSG